MKEKNRTVVISLGEKKYALFLHQVKEFLEMVEITTFIPGPSYLLGIFHLRGEWIPLLNPAHFLGISTPEISPDQLILIGHMFEGLVGLPCQSGELLEGSSLQTEDGLFPMLKTEMDERISFLQIELLATEEEKQEMIRLREVLWDRPI